MQLQTRKTTRRGPWFADTRAQNGISTFFHFALLLYYSLNSIQCPLQERDTADWECWDLSSKKEKGSTLRRNLVNWFCKALHITRIDTGNGNSAVLGSVDRMLVLVSEVKPNIPFNSPRVLIYPFALESSRYRQTCRSKWVSKHQKSTTWRMLTWEVMWLQSRALPNSSRFFLSKARMVIMRSAIPLTSLSHCLWSCWSLRILAAIRAPCTGGLEYNGRTKILTWESTRFFSSADSQTMENAPTRSP